MGTRCRARLSPHGRSTAPPKHAALVHAVMDQLDRAFVPDLLVVPVGSTVSFPNSDSVSHQIYSFSSAKRFQLPLYRGKPYPPVLFDQTGVVTLGCNIHDEMLAYLVVTDAPYFGRSDRAGSWSAELGPGSLSGDDLASAAARRCRRHGARVDGRLR